MADPILPLTLFRGIAHRFEDEKRPRWQVAWSDPWVWVVGHYEDSTAFSSISRPYIIFEWQSERRLDVNLKSIR
jgi:hypothetical protein